MDLTKGRILEAAGEEFAEKGYEEARVRSICRRAAVKNQAAVNYYFGDKESLYLEAVRLAHRCSAEDEPSHFAPAASPSEQLRTFVSGFLRGVIERRQQPSWHHALMFREMMKPTAALETLVAESIRPRFEMLTAILKRVCPEADDRRIHALSFSVIGQCLHYKMAQAVSERLIGGDAWEALDAEFVAEHVTNLCLAALGLVPAFDRTGKPAAQSDGEGENAVSLSTGS